MIKPSDLPDIHVNTARQTANATDAARQAANAARQADIETVIDREIARHHGSGMSWPCLVRVTRSGFLSADVAVVLDRYRDVGWLVTATDTGRYLCSINPPCGERLPDVGVDVRCILGAGHGNAHVGAVVDP